MAFDAQCTVKRITFLLYWLTKRFAGFVIPISNRDEKSPAHVRGFFVVKRYLLFYFSTGNQILF